MRGSLLLQGAAHPPHQVGAAHYIRKYMEGAAPSLHHDGAEHHLHQVKGTVRRDLTVVESGTNR